jgi:hypothetical protein
MPGQIRLQYPGAIYHLMSRGDRREEFIWMMSIRFQQPARNDRPSKGLSPSSNRSGKKLATQNRETQDAGTQQQESRASIRGGGYRIGVEGY